MCEESINKKSDKSHWERYWSRKGGVREYYSNADRVISRVFAATSVKGKRILEVGAGTGRDGFKLVDAGATVFLLDYTQRSLSIMKELAREEGKKVILIMADALAIPFADGVFDVVFHQGLLEHFREPLPLLRENHRVLGSDGICVVDVPQKFHVYTAIKHILIWLNAWFAGWETEFTVRGLDEIIRRAGFGIRSFYGEWMCPSLAYRMFREALLCIGLRLPMYPKGPKVLRSIRVYVRAQVSRIPWSLNTCLNIGVVAEKSSKVDL